MLIDNDLRAFFKLRLIEINNICRASLSAIGVDYQAVADFVHGVTHRSLILLLWIYGRTGFFIFVRLLFFMSVIYFPILFIRIHVDVVGVYVF